VVIAFVGTSSLSILVTCIIQILCDHFRQSTYRKLLEPLALSLSDQQLATGLALCISTLFTREACTITAYHYDIICGLVVISMTTHLVSTLSVRGYTQQNPALISIFRVALMLVQGIFGVLLLWKRRDSKFPTDAPASINGRPNYNTSLILPVACFQGGNGTFLHELDSTLSHSNSEVIALGFIVAFYVLMIFLHHWQKRLDPSSKPSEGQKPQWESGLTHKLRIMVACMRFGLVIGAIVILSWTSTHLISLRDWMGNSGWLGEDNDENKWTFAQILPVIMMSSTILALVDAVPDWWEARKNAGKPDDSDQEKDF